MCGINACIFSIVNKKTLKNVNITEKQDVLNYVYLQGLYKDGNNTYLIRRVILFYCNKWIIMKHFYNIFNHFTMLSTKSLIQLYKHDINMLYNMFNMWFNMLYKVNVNLKYL